MLPRTGQRNHVRPLRLRNLHRQMPNPTRSPVNQHPIPFLHPGLVDKPLPRGQRRQRQRRSLNMTQRLRLPSHLPRGRSHILRVTRCGPRKERHPEHLFPDLIPRARPDRLDHPRDIPPHPERRLPQQRKRPRPHSHINRMDRTRLHPHEHLPRQQLRLLELHNLEHLGPTKALLNDCTHSLHLPLTLSLGSSLKPNTDNVMPPAEDSEYPTVSNLYPKVSHPRRIPRRTPPPLKTRSGSSQRGNLSDSPR
ncbi:hypothetical protein NSERUTF1_7237 [Nocardia seriolae]|nr:hypothetical protein NSERUTF1_7237 [Nocardia seriolae]